MGALEAGKVSPCFCEKRGEAGGRPDILTKPGFHHPACPAAGFRVSSDWFVLLKGC